MGGRRDYWSVVGSGAAVEERALAVGLLPVWLCPSVSGVTRGGGEPPRVTPSGGRVTRTDLKLFFVAEFRENTGETTWKGGSGEETTAKEVYHFQRRWLKKVARLCPEKIGWHPSVAFPGDSDATASSRPNRPLPVSRRQMYPACCILA